MSVAIDVIPKNRSIRSGSSEFGLNITNRASPIDENDTAKWRLGAVLHCARISFVGVRLTSGYLSPGVSERKYIKFINEPGGKGSSSGSSRTDSYKSRSLSARSCAYVIFLFYIIDTNDLLILSSSGSLS